MFLLIIVFAQILIGRLFFRQWKKLLPPLLGSLFRIGLYFLWAAVAARNTPSLPVHHLGATLDSRAAPQRVERVR